MMFHVITDQRYFQALLATADSKLRIDCEVWPKITEFWE